MALASKRGRVLDAFEKKHKKQVSTYYRVEIAGIIKEYPVYKYPIKELYYNIDNGRMRIERNEWEENEGRVLDQYEDGPISKDILLGLDKAKTKELKGDIRKKGQIEPGVITFDGVVINGNRRMAVIEELHEEDSSGKWTFLEAVRLPEDISEENVWKIEVNLQLSMDKISAYNPINELLKIRQGRERGLKTKEIAEAMFGRANKWVEDSLHRIDLMDQFLEKIGAIGNYGFLKHYELNEYFIDIQKYTIIPAKKEEVKKSEIQRRINFAYDLLKKNTKDKKEAEKGLTHLEFRKLRDIYADFDAYQEFLGYTYIDGQKSDSPNVSIDSFKNALDIVNAKDEILKPLNLLDKAIKTLNNITFDVEDIDKKAISAKINELSEVLRDLRADLEAIG